MSFHYFRHTTDSFPDSFPIRAVQKLLHVTIKCVCRIVLIQSMFLLSDTRQSVWSRRLVVAWRGRRSQTRPRQRKPGGSCLSWRLRGEFIARANAQFVCTFNVFMVSNQCACFPVLQWRVQEQRRLRHNLKPRRLVYTERQESKRPNSKQRLRQSRPYVIQTLTILIFFYS